jgi:hypothetical protein
MWMKRKHRFISLPGVPIYETALLKATIPKVVQECSAVPTLYINNSVPTARESPAATN